MSSPLSALSNLTKQAGDESSQGYASGAQKGSLLNSLAPRTGASGTARGVGSPRMSQGDRVNAGGRAKFGSRPGEQRINTAGMVKPLGSFKKGGKVKKTGVYKLHKKERVLNAKQTAKVAAKGGVAKVLSGDKD